jgi:lipid II:glycine glycyltransferase (peptidoglycan interpeptide bridge formation enzyme)
MVYEKRIIDSKAEWDQLVGKTAPHAFFSSWRWGEVEKLLGHTVVRTAWFSEGTFVAAASCIIVKSRRGTLMLVRHGPVMSDISQFVLKTVVDDLRILGKHHHVDVVRLSPLVAADPYERMIVGCGLRRSPIYGMDAQFCRHIDVTKSEDEILAGMKKNTRYDIKKADGSGITIHISRGTNDIGTFKKLYDETAKRQGFVEHEGIEEELSVFGEDACIITASKDGVAISSSVIVFEGNQGIYRHAASIPNSSGASARMVWEIIRETKRRGKPICNLWGVSPEENTKHAWAGLSRFKRGFGGCDVQYAGTYDIALTPKYMMVYALDHIKKWRKGF